MRKIASPEDATGRVSQVLTYLQRPHPERMVAARMLRSVADSMEPANGLTIKTATMSVLEFWRLTEPYGWGTKTTDYKSIQKDLMRKMTPEQAKDLNQTFRNLKIKLYETVIQAEKAREIPHINVGDDSFDDLQAHIIGMGRREYEAVMKNPALAAERGNAGKFSESFSYALPHPQDYKKLSR